MRRSLGMNDEEPRPAAADEARRQVEALADRLKSGGKKSKVSHAVVIEALILIVQEQQREILRLRADMERLEDETIGYEDA